MPPVCRLASHQCLLASGAWRAGVVAAVPAVCVLRRSTLAAQSAGVWCVAHRHLCLWMRRTERCGRSLVWCGGVILLSPAAWPVLAVRCLKQVKSAVQTHNIKRLLISLQSLEEFEVAYVCISSTLANAEIAA